MTAAIGALRHLALAALLLHLAPYGATAELRMQFKAWSVTCAGERYCSASTRLRSDDPELRYAYLLRVSRYESGEREIAFLAARDRPANDAEIAVRVDGKPAAALAPESGWRAVGGGNTFLVAGGHVAALLEAMRTGKRVELRYRSTRGKPVVVEFPLAGFAPALAVVDPGPARRAQQPPPAQPRAPTAAAAVDAEPGSQPAVVMVDADPQSSAAVSAPTPPAKRAAGPAPAAGRKRVKAVRQFACRGNEPSWNLTIDNDRARFELLFDGQPTAIALAGKLGVSGEGRTPDVDWRGKSADGRAYRALIQQQSCADSMSDAEGQTAFDYRVQFTLPGGRTLIGCCNAGLEQRVEARAEPDPAQAPAAALGTKSPVDWSRMLMEMLPAIDACLARTPGASPYVTKAWSMNRGMVGVRTRNATVGWFECIAQSDGKVIDQFGPVQSGAPPVPGEETVLYTPAAYAPPSGNCFTHERVMDAGGGHIGGLSTNECAARPQPRAAQ